MGSKSRPMLDFQFHHFLACVISLMLSFLIYKIILVQFSSVAQSRPTLCDSMNCSISSPQSSPNSGWEPKPLSKPLQAKAT